MHGGLGLGHQQGHRNDGMAPVIAKAGFELDSSVNPSLACQKKA